MPVIFRRNVTQISRALYVNLPKEIAEFLEVEKGDSVRIYVIEDQKAVVIKKETKDQE